MASHHSRSCFNFSILLHFVIEKYIYVIYIMMIFFNNLFTPTVNSCSVHALGFGNYLATVSFCYMSG